MQTRKKMWQSLQPETRVPATRDEKRLMIDGTKKLECCNLYYLLFTLAAFLVLSLV